MNLKFNTAMQKLLLVQITLTTAQYLILVVNSIKKEGILMGMYNKFGSLKESQNLYVKRS